MTTLLANSEKTQNDLSVIRAILLAAHETDLVAEPWNSATSRPQAIAISIALKKCAGNMPDTVRHQILSDLCGREIERTYQLGKRVAMELLDWFCGPGGSLTTPSSEDVVLVIRFLAGGFWRTKDGA